MSSYISSFVVLLNIFLASSMLNSWKQVNKKQLNDQFAFRDSAKVEDKKKMESDGGKDNKKLFCVHFFQLNLSHYFTIVTIRGEKVVPERFQTLSAEQIPVRSRFRIPLVRKIFL